ncbi:disulfide bond formation protein B [Phenylobacterium sp. J426]|uniref:disulfide bond formation protein B n=1 Tax=Phenylobacterium sp. J426 TaxID=2898439 RepID=UPI002151FCD2|nr:disulfide bond formation protein B [Phenylobacterium sp. J426]
MTFLRPFLDRWRLCALLASTAMLATAHAFETFGGYAPCTLCLRQREVYWTALGLAAAFMVIVRLPGGPRWREATCWILGLVFAVGVGVAVYHAGAEWKFWPGPTACAATGGGVDAAALNDFLAGATVRPPPATRRPGCSPASPWPDGTP